jgi:hypothetical protein
LRLRARPAGTRLRRPATRRTLLRTLYVVESDC